MKRNFLWMAGLALGVLITACSTKQENDEAVQAIAFENMDSTYSPADDFFMFVNGKWVEKTAIPDDQGRWGSFNELRETNNEVVLNVLEKAAESGKYEEGSDQQKAADFYAIGMDSLLAEKVGIEPLMPHFEKIRSIESKESLQSYLQEQQQSGGGAFFSFSVFADLMNSSMNTAYLGQGGLGLPDKDYYFPEEERMVEIREKYVDHIARMMQFIGYTAEEAAQAAEKIMALETDLAAGSMNRREQRNIPALYNKFAVTDLPELSSSIDWPAYFESFEITNIDTIIVMQPKYFEAFEGVLASYSIDEWQKYLEWRLIDETANYLNHDIVAANFDFFGKELNGLEQMRSRWKRVLGTTNGFLGEAIGKLYVDEVFPPISHGFDDQGSRFDAEGNMVNWWKPEDKQQFDERSALLVKQFASYEPLEGVYVDGQLTLGENIGDLGGVNAALSGLQKYYGKYGRPEDIDGLTPEQRFFISWATIWRIKYRDEALRTQIKTDPHSPGMYRANGPLRNIPEFYAAFNVTENNEMYQPDSLRVVIW
jgi:predicted metalloendopeptidase